MKKLTEKDIRKEFKFSMNKDTCPFDRLYDRVSNDRYIFDWDVYLPTKGINLQRPFVWTLFQKQQFILSLMKGAPIPKVAVIRHEDVDKKITWQVIDGKQRLSTFHQFIGGEFPIIHNDVEYYFNDLDEMFQYRLNVYNFYGDVAFSYYDKPISDEDKIIWFNQINFAGTPQDDEHMKKLLAAQNI